MVDMGMLLTKVRKGWKLYHLLGISVIFIQLSICLTSLCLAEENNGEEWKRRKYYSEEGILQSIEEHFFDDQSQLIKEEISFVGGEPEGTYTEFQYDEKGQIIKGVICFRNDKPSGTTLSYEYDEQGRIYKIETKSATSEEYTLYEYDDNNHIICRTCLNGENSLILKQVIAYEYDNDKRVVSCTIYNEEPMEQDESLDGDKEKTVSLLICIYEYDNKGRLIKEYRTDEHNEIVGYYEYEY